MPPISQVHIDRALTNVSIMYRNMAFIADDVWPVLPVNLRSDKYFIYKKEDFTRNSGLDNTGRPKSIRRPGGISLEEDFQVSTGSYSAENLSKSALVPDENLQNADSPLQPEIDETTQLTDLLMLDNEMAVASLVLTRGSYPSANKAALTGGAAGTSWAQYSSVNSNPFANVQAARLQVIKSILKPANTIAMGSDTALTLLDHPAYKDAIKYTHADVVTMSGLIPNFRGLDVVEGATQQNTAAEGANYSGGYVWDADDGTAAALVYYRNPAPSLRTVSFGWTFEAPDATTQARGFSVRKWRDEPRKGTKVEVNVTRDWKAVAIDSNSKLVGGYLITSCTA